MTDLKIESVKIDPMLHKQLLNADNHLKELDAAVQRFLNVAQTKMRMYERDVRTAWGKVAEQHPDIDFSKVNYVPHPDKAEIVPVSVKLDTSFSKE